MTDDKLTNCKHYHFIALNDEFLNRKSSENRFPRVLLENFILYI